MLDPGDVFQPPGLLRSREAITGARSLTANDNGLLLEATSGSGTIDGSAVTLGAGFKFTVYNSGSGSPVFDPALTQTVRLPTGTVSTVTILQGQGLTLVSDGTNWIGVLGIGFGSTPGTAVTVRDNVFTIQDDADPTKQLQFQCASIATGTTRTLTAPNADITLAGINLAQTWTAAQTFSAVTTTAGIQNTTGDITSRADEDAQTILGRLRTGFITGLTDNAAASHFDHATSSSYCWRQDSAGASVFNSASGQSLRLSIGNTAVATVSSTALTLASGINLAMSGASTLTMGTGAASFGGMLTALGNVGVGTTNPVAAFVVASGTNLLGLEVTFNAGAVVQEYYDRTGAVYIPARYIASSHSFEQGTLIVASGQAMRLGNAAVAATPTATHTMTIQDSTGTTYRVLCVV